MPNHNLYVHREKAEQVREKYNATVARVLADRDLSEEGRDRKLASAWVEARSKLDDLGQRESELLTGRRSELERSLFGGSVRSSSLDAGAAAISSRDAADRAGQLKNPADAVEALRRADADGDEVLARAIMRQATRAAEEALRPTEAKAWESVMMEFVDARPQVAGTIEELAEVETLSQRQVFSPFSIPQPHGVAPQLINQAQQESSGVSA